MNVKKLTFYAAALGAGFAVAYLWQGRGELTSRAIEQQEVQSILTVASVPSSLDQIDAESSNLVVRISSPSGSESSIRSAGQFDEILRSDRGERKRAQFEAEYLDPVFAAAAEAQWRSYYAVRPHLAVVSIECRATLCETRVVGHGMAKQSLQMTLLNSRDLPWGSEVPGQRLVDISILVEEQGTSAVAVVYTQFGSPPAFAPGLRQGVP